MVCPPETWIRVGRLRNRSSMFTMQSAQVDFVMGRPMFARLVIDSSDDRYLVLVGREAPKRYQWGQEFRHDF